jgi:hypothetical protein
VAEVHTREAVGITIVVTDVWLGFSARALPAVAATARSKRTAIATAS